jgi:processive 1,2-diacylglycerol beta-glucosyltransferase
MKLLLVSASAGSGHTRAAQALEEEARIRYPLADVQHVDVLDYALSAYKRTYASGYLQLVNHIPTLWGYLYDASDDVRQNRSIHQKILSVIDRLELRTFRTFVREFEPDVVLATHFHPAQVFASDVRHARVPFSFGVVVTDFDVHAYWVQPSVDRYFVATEETRAVLTGRGVRADRTHVTGIPISHAFTRQLRRASARATLGIADATRVILVMGGGVGLGALEESVDAALACAPVHVLAVAGTNEELRATLEKKRVPAGSRLQVFGFVDTIHELMAAADLVITKPGGLTSSECLAVGLPMILRDPIPGQEERNADTLLELGAAVKARGVDVLRYKIRTLLEDEPRLARMHAAAKRAGHPDAAASILHTMLG